jgi:hypothetical protein
MEQFKTIKEAYRSIKDTLLYKDGPSRCDSAHNIAKLFGGEQEQIHAPTSTAFDIPVTSQPCLDSFFSAISFREIPEVTITRIPGGSAHAGGVIISPDGTTIARDLSVDFGVPVSTHFLLDKRITRPQRLRGSALSVASASSCSYYHWLLDELPRLLLATSESFNSIICSRDSSQHRQALEMIGTQGKQIVYTDTNRRLPGNHYSADILIAPSYISPVGEPSPLLVKLLKDFAKSVVSESITYPAKIYISRSKARGRRLLNEEKLYPILEAAGFRVINLEDLTWHEQINLFHNAQEIISPHGAGLANIVFCSNAPKVIELFHSSYVHWCFWKLAHLVGARYIPIALPIGTDIDHNPAVYLQKDISINDCGLKIILDAVDL